MKTEGRVRAQRRRGRRALQDRRGRPQKIIELKLSKEEADALRKSVDVVRENIAALKL